MVAGLERCLDEVDLLEVERRVREDIVGQPNPTLWSYAEQDRLQLLAEVRRLGRLLQTSKLAPYNEDCDTPFPPMQKASSLEVGQKGEGGFTGDTCDKCGSFSIIRTGSCTTCQDCGSSGGCA